MKAEQDDEEMWREQWAGLVADRQRRNALSSAPGGFRGAFERGLKAVSKSLDEGWKT